MHNCMRAGCRAPGQSCLAAGKHSSCSPPFSDVHCVRVYRINCQQLISEHVHLPPDTHLDLRVQVTSGCSIVIQERLQEQDISQVRQIQNVKAQVRPDPGQLLRRSFVTVHAAMMCGLAGESTPAPKPLASVILYGNEGQDASMEELNLSRQCSTDDCPVGVGVEYQFHVHYDAACTSSGRRVRLVRAMHEQVVNECSRLDNEFSCA